MGWEKYPRHFLSGVKALTRGLISTFCRQWQFSCLSGAITRCVRIPININGVCQNIKTWNLIVKHVRVGLQFIPSILRYVIVTLTTMNGRKIKRPMNECIRVSEVQIFLLWQEITSIGIGLRSVRWPNVVSVSQRCGANNVILTVALEPEPLVDSTIPITRRMGKVKIHQIAAIHQAGRMEKHSCIESHMDQTPLANITGTDRVRNEE